MALLLFLLVKSLKKHANTEKELKESYYKLEEANGLKDEFLSIMSHELRTPLHAMLGFSQLMAMDNTLEDKHRKYVNIIYSSGEKLLKVLSDLIELSIIESGGAKCEYSKFNISSCVNDTYILLKEQFEQKGIEFVKNIHISDTIYSDPIKVRQVLLNIIGNAVKFTEKGRIEIQITPDNGNILFEISDTGIGILEDNFELIFEKFRQEESGKTRRYGGAGLGLSLSKKLIQSLGGKIWVKSKKDFGSSFFFTIPALKAGENKTFDKAK
jgi:signal transduction histidine kinase